MSSSDPFRSSSIRRHAASKLPTMESSLIALLFLLCIILLGLLPGSGPDHVSAFRTPVVFPPMDAAKYVDPSVLDRPESFDQSPEEQILANDGIEPEENHEHAEEAEFIHSDADNVPTNANETDESRQKPGEPVALAQRGVAPRVKAPEHSLAVWDSDGTICILARLQAFFRIPYATATGQQYASIKMPPNRELATRGACPTDARDPLFEVQWPLFRFIMHFARSRQRSSWFVNKLEVQYNTNSPLFPGALNAGKRYASTTQNITLFMTPMGQSYGCPLHPPLALAIVNATAKIMVKLKDIRLQAYRLTGNYGPLSRCQQVAMAHTLDPYNYDRTVPVAVGSTLAGVSLATIIGYALYRSMFARKVDYGTMQ